MDPFGELRSLLNRPASAEHWSRLCELLDAFDPRRLDGQIFPYIEGFVRRWPDALCVAPEAWVRRALEGEELPFWSIVRAIDLSYQYLDAEQVLRLLGSERLAQVTILDLDSNRVGAEGARVIAEAPALGALEVLGLGFNALGEEGLRALAQARHLSRLRALNLERNALRSVGILAQTGWLPGLVRLELQGNAVSGAALARLAVALDGGPLAHLDLSYNGSHDGSGRRGWVSLAQVELPALEVCALRSCELRDRDVEALMEAPWVEGLRELDLSRNRDLTSASARALARAAPASLRQLRLGSVELELRDLERILDALPVLRRLECDVRDPDALDALSRRAPRVTVFHGR